jgi:DNA-directed RNA polymerase specialized sigma24 family protein
MKHSDDILDSSENSWNGSMPHMDTIDSHQETQLTVVNLYRLLYAMERDDAPTGQSWQSLLTRAELAQSLWQRIAPSVRDRQSTTNFKAWQYRVERACARAQQAAEDRRRQDPNAENDLVKQIFFANRQSPQETGQGEDDENDDDDESTSSQLDTFSEQTPSPSPNAATTNQRFSNASLEDLQKEQRNQIEQAIGQMAAQMKAEMSRIHETLRNQTEDLDDMEDLAADNVQKVSEVADDVKHHVSASWSRTIGTWTMIFVMLGAFLFCLVTIQMAPKRKGTCLFYCPTPDTELFCRLLPTGQKECVDSEQIRRTKVDEAAETEDSSFLYMDDTNQFVFDNGDPQDKLPSVATCELDMNGDCVEEYFDDDEEVFVLPPAEQIRHEALRDYTQMQCAANDIQASLSEASHQVEGIQYSSPSSKDEALIQSTKKRESLTSERELPKV